MLDACTNVHDCACVRLCTPFSHTQTLCCVLRACVRASMRARVQDVAVAEECYTQQLRSYQQLTAQVLCFLFAFRELLT